MLVECSSFMNRKSSKFLKPPKKVMVLSSLNIGILAF